MLLYRTVSDIGYSHDSMYFSLQDGWTALMKASEAGQVECIKVLLDRGAEVNMQDTVSGVDVNPLLMHRMKNVTNLITCG